MRPRKGTYILHRWLGLLVSVQLLAGSLGGLVFSILPLDVVRGERDAAMLDPLPVDPTGLVDLEAALSAAGGPDEVGNVELRDRGAGPAWEIHDAGGALAAVVDARTGERRGLISVSTAREIAQAGRGPARETAT